MTSAVRLGAGGRGPWWALVAGLTVLGVLEAVLLHWAADALLPAGPARVVDVVVGGATAALLLVMASPLWSRHRVANAVSVEDAGTLVRALGGPAATLAP
ncbi:hypothetical protein ATJ88_1244 [Isoptericola jiangsuensis]|uniref:Uncharacterized protein n=1 Tax=Isoptericola jiangsuensis TaxID=548579 RepID=A0A2A9EVN8_9MICO|nr:hypothetical protein [Isoptericola jiangsuensis]PFG42581.1 hypothetical protein ATJ88_1244 [Isoptericola jiangsuensis]